MNGQYLRIAILCCVVCVCTQPYTCVLNGAVYTCVGGKGRRHVQSEISEHSVLICVFEPTLTRFGPVRYAVDRQLEGAISCLQKHPLLINNHCCMHVSAIKRSLLPIHYLSSIIHGSNNLTSAKIRRRGPRGMPSPSSVGSSMCFSSDRVILLLLNVCNVNKIPQI